MASKGGKGEKSFQEKFKSWFKGSKGPATGHAVPGPDSGPPLAPVEFKFSADLNEALCDEAPAAERLKLIRQITPVVREQILQEHGVELLWMKTKDLADSEVDDERRAVLEFYEALVAGQFNKLDVMRAQFFRIIDKSHRKSDLSLVLKFLESLTKQGQDILHFEEKVGPFLLRTFPLVTSDIGLLVAFLKILLNMIKFNPAYLDPEVVCGLISFLSHVCVIRADGEAAKLSLQCFYAIMGYSYIPKEALQNFICTLCRVVNVEEHCTESWRIMGQLMGTHLGHSALYSLCQIIQSKEYQTDFALVRGAIFFIGMSLWGSKCVKNMQTYSAMTILPTFVIALNCEHHIVTYEVTLQLENLVTRRGETLRAPGSDSALELIRALLEIIPRHSDPTIRAEILRHVHISITEIERLWIKRNSEEATRSCTT